MTSVAETSLDSFKSRRTLKVGKRSYDYFSLAEAEANGLDGISLLPFRSRFCSRICCATRTAGPSPPTTFAASRCGSPTRKSDREIAFRPARVLMQDFTGVPAVVDLAAMRDAMAQLGGDPEKINPLVPVDLVIDHSVMVDSLAQATPSTECRAGI